MDIALALATAEMLEEQRGVAWWTGCFLGVLGGMSTYFQAFRAFEISQPGHSSRYHETDEVVIVQWRRKLSQETLQTSLLNVPFPFNDQSQSWNEQICRNNHRHMHRLINQQPVHGRRFCRLYHIVSYCMISWKFHGVPHAAFKSFNTV